MAAVDPRANLADGVTIGPAAVIDGGATIGNGTEIMAHTHIMAGVTLAANCRVFPGCIIGGAPQDIKFKGGDTPVFVGEGTVLREYVTIHRSTREEGTVIGKQAYLMAYVHVGHDSSIGDHVILANLVQLGGFAQIHDYAFIGGTTPVHQFCRVGAYTMVGGGYRVVQDIPPYIMASGEPLRFGGLNVIGLRRHGFSSEVRDQIKKAYKTIYRSEYNLSQALAVVKNELPPTREVQSIVDFFERGTRGFI
jgi:UDP-N-acetylglucosamine acyltransferase